MSQQFILNADDFGLSKTINETIFKGYTDGFLKSASICTNGDAFSEAITISQMCPGLGIGVHLNIIEGKALAKDKNYLLTSKDGFFNNGFLQIFLKSHEKLFLRAVEEEFRAQIEAGKKHITFDHVDSHVHTHAIPPIFEITCKLAKEYGIHCIRTQYEEKYTVPNIKKQMNIKYPVNMLKTMLLNNLSKKNKRIVKEFLLKRHFLF